MQLGGKVILEDIAGGLEDVKIPVVNDVDDEGPPKIVYLQRPRALPVPDDKGVNLAEYLLEEGKKCPGCSCQNACQDFDQCACRLRTKTDTERWTKIWDLVGKGKPNPFDEFPMASYECNPNCSCQVDLCTNRLAQKKIKLPLQVFKTHKIGYGVRCSIDIPKGTFISTYTGTLLQRSFMKTLELLRGKVISGSYMAKLIDIGKIYQKKPGEFSTIMDEWEFGVDAAFPVNGPYPGGNVSRFFNHSCDPNIISRLVFVETHDTRLPHLAFFALRDIKSGEQIFWDYAYDASPSSSFRCQCVSEKCRWKDVSESDDDVEETSNGEYESGTETEDKEDDE